MINGAHFLLYSKDADADRAFLRDVLGMRAVDVGHGWLIFALPPAEVAVHPGDGSFVQQHVDQKLMGAVLYFMCDDVKAEVHGLEKKGVNCTELMEAEWGIATSFALPSGPHIGLYQPKHQTAIAKSRT